jgi:hypothetical protein
VPASPSAGWGPLEYARRHGILITKNARDFVGFTAGSRTIGIILTGEQSAKDMTDAEVVLALANWRRRVPSAPVHILNHWRS